MEGEIGFESRDLCIMNAQELELPQSGGSPGSQKPKTSRLLRRGDIPKIHNGNFHHPCISACFFAALLRTLAHDSQSVRSILWYLNSNGCCLGTLAMTCFARSISPSAMSIQASSRTSGICPNRVKISWRRAERSWCTRSSTDPRY